MTVSLTEYWHDSQFADFLRAFISESYFFYQEPGYHRDCKNIYNKCSSSNSSGVFSIKPYGYPETFEVYCDNDYQLGGWTVIQRRVDGSVDFDRDWQEYKDGFGFLSTEFWLGNEKLSYLTNQAKYELRIDIVLSNGTSQFASYSAFRISDEWSQYSLVETGNFHGNIDFADISCPPNMTFGKCSSQPSCDDPSGVNSRYDDCTGEAEVCVCLSGFLMKDGKCVHPHECGCFLTQTNSVLQVSNTINISLSCVAMSLCIFEISLKIKCLCYDLEKFTLLLHSMLRGDSWFR
ncbi:Fibrinogen-like protein A [Holothuria leucospilota]|uniref:Fibrinogen-like protein A n=1 Tax=Holothuria leucospilota TaxID=206669 RepID=A0A9Q1H4Q4_HOLLE|nr:Fibrinogen-like protein A [Holothuria leucospilota]